MRIGNKELEILTFIAENSGSRVADVAAHFAEKDGIKRTTISKTIDRLVEKGLLTREGEWGEYGYRATADPKSLQQELTEQFVHHTLNGSIAPFVAYLRGGADISKEDLAELKILVKNLEEEKS